MTLLALVLAYLLGSIPAGAWVAHGRGVDIRKVGSGNTGATNVARAVGTGAGLTVAAFDALKGVLAVLLARIFVQDPIIETVCGALAVLGHNFSVFLRFRGGKGVATSLGTVIAINPLVGLSALVIGGSCIALTRFVSAGSIVGAVATSVLALVVGAPVWELGVILFLSALLIWQHRDNMKRLQAGSERRLGEKIQA
ncbi:glycerol-3-phosphate 1-O-acyltransferase PlsY [Deinococcus peraridilitoris]|uniref:Glycerol-3-phosphate acyltransferase n=1 Tax=Deinococcus peraridilitoris (strain DSM 19664 / LMG 22246 / CIP 109416 / KR-200) TaxID=937777 RepID=K9ZZU3_DEIPD|nr:glycerol-3-phosphate 1-O-acyltransferase PlsY [Deinococcus peraridilitoris]AFZ66462.1 acyl-phosphate glycerol 3-phosphate acyltransferase [Deinococcus peraridilitoris DSM 19664]